jgi:hypothetical protein
MSVGPGSVRGVELIRPGAPEFGSALEAILGRAPDGVLIPALPYSVIARNNDTRPIALLGIRFDMVGPKLNSFSVVHYADKLRQPEKADLLPGGMRFVCAEPRYTDMVLRREHEVDQRGKMNLENLRTVLHIEASLDCVAFDDGQFGGPDSLGAFERFERERDAEIRFLNKISKSDCAIGELLTEAASTSVLRMLARGGSDELAERARNHRVRIKIWRSR